MLKENFLFSKEQFDKGKKLNMCISSRRYYYIKERTLFLRNQGKNYDEHKLLTIQDKINYLTIHESPDYKTNIVDKILLHKYSKKILGKDICVPILKIYNNTNEININELPKKFVLKCNHGSGMNILCINKYNFDLNKNIQKIKNWQNLNYGIYTTEFQYININKKIFVEKFLKENIEDYKIYCFHGNPKFIRVQKKLDNKIKVNNYYDLEWNLLDIETGLPNFERKPEIIFQKPRNLKKMIKYAKKLSFKFVFVRVDFYNIYGKIYLGEMTFTPSAALFNLKNRAQSIELGKLIDITKINSALYV